MPKDNQHIVFLNNYYNSLVNPDILTEPTKQTAIRCNAAHIPPTTPGVDGVDSQIVGRHISECRRRARNQPRAERNQAWQVDILEVAYRQSHYPSAGQRMILMSQTNLSYRKIKNWFEQKAKMLKKAGGGPVVPNPGSNKYSTKMWREYFADPVGYVQKLRNGEIDLLTGEAIGQAVSNLANAPANGPTNNTNEDLGLAALAPGTTIVPGPDYQSGYQHDQDGSPNIQSQPYNQMSQYGQYDNSNVQTPPQSQVPQQAQYGPQPISIYTQAQDLMYTMPPAQSMNSGISSYAAGRSYEVSRAQPAPQQTAHPGAHTADTISQGAAPALFDGIKQAVPDQYSYGMPANSQSGSPYDLFADQDDEELEYEGQNGPLYPPVPQHHAGQYMPAYPQVPESPAGQLLGGTFTQSEGPTRKRKSAPEDDELNQGPYSIHLRKRPCQTSDSRYFAPSTTGNFAGAAGKMEDTREPSKRSNPLRPVQKTRRRPVAGQFPNRKISWNGTDDSMNSSFDRTGAKWSPHPPSRLNICHRSPWEEDKAETGATSPNIRTPNIRTPEVRDADSEAQRLEPLFFGSGQDVRNNEMEQSSGQLPAPFKPPMRETSRNMAQGVVVTQHHATTNSADPAAAQDNAARHLGASSPRTQNISGSLDGNWEADLEVQGFQQQQDSAFPQGEAQEIESSAQIPTEGKESFEDMLAVPDMNALEQAFLHNGEFDYSAFLGNDGLFEDWDPPNLDGEN
ncbi:uncharacterized protein EAF02_000202 [Botrytis sinoallii]|uniref:uncharacterized protein n=1 Tax=Botrytis sinoallii TaxID=1463999 RepID=UPI001902357F|nr:uncharacterized protein EAF02_000202 [Botrytis sinoallii]KAF7892664.1 hypothetical protein EAF02_000202 [Botrytis sinoallii]